MSETYQITRDPADPKSALGCIDLCESEDDGGWYAHQYDFTRPDHSTRISAKIYPSRDSLVRALASGKHRWEQWS